MYENIVKNGNFPEFVRLASSVNYDVTNVYVDNTILHIPTGRLIMIVQRNMLKMDGEFISMKFKQHKPNDEPIEMIAVIIPPDGGEDIVPQYMKRIKENILRPAVRWFSDDLYKWFESKTNLEDEDDCNGQ